MNGTLNPKLTILQEHVEFLCQSVYESLCSTVCGGNPTKPRSHMLLWQTVSKAYMHAVCKPISKGFRV